MLLAFVQSLQCCLFDVKMVYFDVMTSNSSQPVKLRPGQVRDAVVTVLACSGRESLPLAEIHQRVENLLGHEISPSSVRSSLNLNEGVLFIRVGRGMYRLAGPEATEVQKPIFAEGLAKLYLDDCLSWLRRQPDNSIHAVVTDPPYGVAEYSAKEQDKLRKNSGGVWRIPPTLDGVQRSPLPRFTVMNKDDWERMEDFFREWSFLLGRVLVPGGNVMVAANPLVSHIVSTGISQGGLERRGEIIRLVQTLRGGDRPKGAHDEFRDVTVMPRSQWEPWVLFRKPLEGTVAENLRKWGTGGFRRISNEKPFGDVIKSAPARKNERQIAPHPSLKPQSFLRKVVRASLPLGQGVILDPFAGSGSTLAAANALGYPSIGVERDPEYAEIARSAIPGLGTLAVAED